VLKDGPVEDVVVLEILPVEEVAEDVSKVVVVGLVLETERTTDLKVCHKLLWEAFAKHFDRRAHLSFADLLILKLFSCRLQPLPRERAAEEVHDDVAERFKVVTTALLDAEVGIYAGVPSGTGEVLILAVWYV